MSCPVAYKILTSRCSQNRPQTLPDWLGRFMVARCCEGNEAGHALQKLSGVYCCKGFAIPPRNNFSDRPRIGFISALNEVGNVLGSKLLPPLQCFESICSQCLARFHLNRDSVHTRISCRLSVQSSIRKVCGSKRGNRQSSPQRRDGIHIQLPCV